MSAQRRVVAAIRALLRRAGFDLLHHADDPVLETMMEARERLRVVADSPPWVWDHLLSNVAAQAHLRNLLRAGRFDLVVDVGANDGRFGRLVRRLGYAGPIESFEPIEAVHRGLDAVARADGAWRAHRLAIGAAAQDVRLNVFRDSSFSSLHAANRHGEDRFGEYMHLDHVEEVPMLTLDAALAPRLASGAPRRILLKTDTQGHDLDVLRGAGGTLERTHAVVTEASVTPIYSGTPTYREIIAFLEARGFRPSGLYPISHEPDLSLIELDCFFVRPSADQAESRERTTAAGTPTATL